MGTEVKESIIIAVELLMFSLLLLIIAVFGGFARSSLVRKNLQNDSMTDIREYRNIYEFTEGAQVEVEDFEIDKVFVSSLNGKAYSGISAAYCEAAEAVGRPIANLVKGDDIIRFASLYPKEYEVYIKLSNDDKNNILLKRASDETITEDELSDWDISNLTEVIGGDLSSDFYCVAVYNSYLYEYDTIIFVKK